MKTPPYLKKGDRIAVISPARFVKPDEIEKGLVYLKTWGVDVVPGPNIYTRHHRYAGTDDQRLADLQQMLDDESIRAILFTRGGYGIIRILDRVDFTQFEKSPKWICGYSDITALHAHVERNCGIETVHAPMLFEFDGSPEKIASFEYLRKILFGEEVTYQISNPKIVQPGSVRARITGGNLSILYAIAGSSSECSFDGKILFLEEVDEYYYHVDRMMQQLRRSGRLNGIAGLIAGTMTRMHDNQPKFGKDAYSIIHEYVGRSDTPVLMGFPAGHGTENFPLILGREAELNVGDNSATIRFLAPAASSIFGRMAFRGFWKSTIAIILFFAFLYLIYFFFLQPMLK